MKNLAKTITKVALFTGDQDPPYAYGLARGLKNNMVATELIVGDAIFEDEKIKELSENSDQVNLVHLYENLHDVQNKILKALFILKTYFRLIQYAIHSDVKIFHIQWFYKFQYFERTVLAGFFKIIGKRIIFTAHNVNAAKRDGNENLFNILSLKILYRLSDTIVVHTKKMKNQLIEEFHVQPSKIAIHSIGIYNIFPNSGLKKNEAKKMLGINEHERVLLHFGNILPYKGIIYLLKAIARTREKNIGLKLVVAGEVKKEGKRYWKECLKYIEEENLGDCLVIKDELIPNEEVEVLFKAADVLVLPYTYIFQSGVIFVGYNYGIPIIASDVGSMKEYVERGKTGYIFESKNINALSKTIISFFDSSLCNESEKTKRYIIDYAKSRFSWDKIGAISLGIYKKIF